MKKIYVIGWGRHSDSDVISAYTTFERAREEFEEIGKQYALGTSWKDHDFLITENGAYYYITEVDLCE